MAKTLIMLVRLLGLTAIVIGILLWSGRPTLFGAHIGVGFVVTILIFIMSLAALIKKAMLPGAVGLVLALLLPAVGFMQLPLTFHGWRMVQVVHVMLGLAAIGLGERLYSVLQRS